MESGVCGGREGGRECSFPCRSCLIALTAQLRASTQGLQFRVGSGAGTRERERERGGERGGERGSAVAGTLLQVSFQTK